MTSTARAIQAAALRGVGMTVRDCPDGPTEDAQAAATDAAWAKWAEVVRERHAQLPADMVDLDAFSCPSPNDAD